MPSRSCDRFTHRRQRIRSSLASTATMSRIWQLHFLVSLSVLLLGIASNRGARYGSIPLRPDRIDQKAASENSVYFFSYPSFRKYIPIEPSQLGDGCQKAFLNAMAEHEDDRYATVCCEPLLTNAALDLCSRVRILESNLFDRNSRLRLPLTVRITVPYQRQVSLCPID
jgi:hypothetical protein